MYPDLSKVKKILVVRMRHLGDVLLTSPVFTHLKKTVPEAEIDVLINAESLPMLEGHPAISNYFLYDRRWKSLSFFKKIAHEIKLLLQVRKNQYDLVLNLTEGDRGAIVALVSGAPIRVGFDPEGSGFFGKKRAYTHIVKICPHPRHTVERQLDALRRIGIFPPSHERDLMLHVPEEAIQKMQKFGRGFVLIHPVSRWLFKSPPASFFAELIKALHQSGKKVLLTGGTDKEGLQLIQEIQAKVSDIPMTTLAGKTTLKELAALMRLSAALITVDSVPLHMASALKTPVIALFGPTSEINWGPWMHPKGRVIAPKVSCRPCYMDGCGGSKRSDCLSLLSPDEVMHTLTHLLEI
jgi:lipopolysaccharide heptosyltransferase III